MRFSLFFNFDLLPDATEHALLLDVERLAIAADRLGYHAVWFAEHHFQEYGRMPDPLLFLSRISGQTTRLRLGTAVVEAPYYHPIRLAESAALLDVLSSGRVQLGLGSGAGNKQLEFERFAIPKDEKSARLLEVIEIIRQLYVEPSLEFDGTFHHFHDLSISPRPRQDARSILWLAASPKSIDYAARHALPILLPRPVDEDVLRELIARYRTGLPPGERGHVAALRFTFVADTIEDAHRATRRTFMRYAKYDGDVDWDGHTDTAEYADLSRRLKFVAGTPDIVADRLQAWRDDLGFDEVLCQMYAAGTKADDSLRSMTLFADHVAPLFEDPTA